MCLFVCVCVCDEVVSGQCRMSVAWRIELTQSANVKELQNMMAAHLHSRHELLRCCCILHRSPFVATDHTWLW